MTSLIVQGRVLSVREDQAGKYVGYIRLAKPFWFAEEYWISLDEIKVNDPKDGDIIRAYCDSIDACRNFRDADPTKRRLRFMANLGSVAINTSQRTIHNLDGANMYGEIIKHKRHLLSLDTFITIADIKLYDGSTITGAVPEPCPWPGTKMRCTFHYASGGPYRNDQVPYVSITKILGP